MEYDNSRKYIRRATWRQRYTYFLQLLEGVLLTGVPQIVLEKSARRKAFKLIVFFFCIFGFCYQLTTFLSLYFLYPTTLEVRVQHLNISNMPKPVITVCSMNGLRRSAYCFDFPQHCEKPRNITTFCSKYNQFCDKENFSEDDLWFPNKIHYSADTYNRALVEKYSPRPEDIFRSELRYFTTNIIYESEFMKPKMCYSLDLQQTSHLITTNRYNFQHFFNIDKTILTMTEIQTHPEESFHPFVPVGNKVSIHSRDELVNPFINGFLVTPGYKYIIQLKVIEYDLLSTPYGSNCIANGQSKDNTIEENLNQDLCLTECKKNRRLKVCGCVSSVYPFRYEGKTCVRTSDFICLFHVDVSECFHMCPRNCRYIKFEYEIDKVPLEILKFGENITLDELDESRRLKNRKAMIFIFYKSQHLLVYTVQPKYQLIQMFGYLGGYIGIWLGISLIAVFDFLEMLVTYVYHVITEKVPITAGQEIISLETKLPV